MPAIKKISTGAVFLFITLCIISPFLGSCAIIGDPPSMQHSCRGFDFNKKFPKIKKGEKFLYAEYDTNIKRLKNRDGLFFLSSSFELEADKNPEGRYKSYSDYLRAKRSEEEKRILEMHWNAYNCCDLPLSAKEKRYIAAYDAREREFDRKYVGEIKEKLRKASIFSHKVRGRQPIDRLEYPYYLVGAELPSGLVTPASYFTANFMFEYIRDQTFDANGRRTKAPLIDFILASTPLNLDIDADAAGEIAYNVADGARDRLEALYPEYILTLYNVKKYNSAKERSRVVRDLAIYYSDVAFRGAAEGLFRYRNYLNAGQRCRIANYAASRVYDLVMEMESPEKLAAFKRKYKKNIMAACDGLISAPIFRKEDAGVITKAEGKAQRRAILNKLRTGKTRCIND